MAAKKLTVKQEAFCQAYVGVAKGNKSEAYRIAYEAENMSQESVWTESGKLIANPTVALQIVKLQQEVSVRHTVTVDSLILELEEARDIAKDNDQASGAVAASMGKAKLCGLLIDRKEVTGKDGAPIEVDNNVEIIFNPVGVDD